VENYELLEAENERIFQSDIAEALLSGVAQRIDKPKLILLGGQPGSGKTRALVPGAENDLAASGRAMLIDADQLRVKHTGWKDAILTNDVTAAEKTHPDARKWVRKACVLAIERRCNVILDGTMASPQSIAQVIKQFHDAGYEIEARILAIEGRTSWLGVLYRYEEKKRKRQDARMTPRAVHDDAVDGIPKTLVEIEIDKRVGRIKIVARGGRVLYDGVGAPTVEESASNALDAERTRTREPEEEAQYENDLQQLLSWAAERGISAESLEEYEQRVLEP
jgi:predicted kinase